MTAARFEIVCAANAVCAPATAATTVPLPA